MSYNIKLEIFEGPLDLLLHLIRKHEVDIYDIPISLITSQYLEYIELMKNLDMEIAGDFLVMASALTHIKSRMLLPPPETPENEDDGVDPRAELIQRLLEYKRYKDAAESLEQREELWKKIHARPSEASPELPVDEEEPLLFDFHLFDLLTALKEVLERVPDQQFEITAETVSITEKISHILNRLEAVQSMLFSDLFEGSNTKPQVIATFLALLELVRTRVVKFMQVEEYGAIRLTKAVSETEMG